MYAVNDNFAHMGGIAGLSDGKVVFVASSVSSMNSKANKEKEQVFLQIFDPTQDLSKQSTYIMKGTRTGIAGPNGNEKETDYGVKWLTDIGKDWRIENPQVVSNGDDKIVVFYEKYYEKNYDNVFKGVYYKVLDKNGKVLTKTTLYSKDANLNPSRMPVYSDGTIYWVGNNEKDSKIHVYQMKLD